MTGGDDRGDHRRTEAGVAPVRAAQYVRMSTEHQQYSTENQAHAIRQYADRHGLEIVRTYADEGRSGLRIEGRDALQGLIADVESGAADFTTILVYDVSRWGRFQDIDESAHYEYRCRRAGIQVRYCAEPFENDGSALSTIVKGVKRMMAASAYRHRFGSLLRAYSLVGYLPRRDYRYIEINRTLRLLHPEMIDIVVTGLEDVGATVRRDPETDLINVNDEIALSVVIAPCKETPTGALRWRLRFDTGLDPDITVAVRMDAPNRRPLDYYLFPRIDLASTTNIRLAEENGLSLDAYRFETLDVFYEFATPIRLREVA